MDIDELVAKVALHPSLSSVCSDGNASNFMVARDIVTSDPLALRLAFADAAEGVLRRLDDWWLGLPPAVLGPQEQMLAAIIDEARALLATLTRVDGNESTKA